MIMIFKVLRDQNWDFATEPEIAAEVEEDLMCAKRDVDVSARQRRQADWYTILVLFLLNDLLCVVTLTVQFLIFSKGRLLRPRSSNLFCVSSIRGYQGI